MGARLWLLTEELKKHDMSANERDAKEDLQQGEVYQATLLSFASQVKDSQGVCQGVHQLCGREGFSSDY